MFTIEAIETLPTEYGSLLKRLKSLPLWAKQAICYELKNDVGHIFSSTDQSQAEKGIIQLYKPRLTHRALNLIKNKKDLSFIVNLNTSHKYFLNSCQSNLNILEIAHINVWSLQETCNILIDLIKKELITEIQNKYLMSLTNYLAGRITIGEFLVETNQLERSELESILYTQQYSSNFETDLSFEEVALKFEYLTKEILINLIALKISSKETVSIIDQVKTQAEEIDYYETEISTLLKEKKKLSEKITFYKKELEAKHADVLELTKQLSLYTKGVVGKIFLTLS